MWHLLVLLLVLSSPLQAAERMWWHNGDNELNQAGQQLVDLLLPEPAALAVLSPVERDAWLTREWRQVLAARASFSQFTLPAEQSSAAFDQAQQQGELGDYLRRQQPDYPAYLQLKRHYHALANAPAMVPLPAGPEVRVGERDRAIPALRQRLTALGYSLAAPRGRADALDHQLSERLTALQQAHGLDANGRLTAATRAIVNRTPNELRTELRHNLRRWLVLPPTAPAQYLLVNIPAYRLTLFNASGASLNMKVIVGRPDWPTPELGTYIKALKVNPDWTPTANIIREDLLPVQLQDRGFLGRNGFGVWLPGESGRRDPATINWHQPPAGLRLVQAPGPDNALGRLKFEMNNPFDIYLHDTPDKQLFGESRLALSHGCVRLAEADRLAQSLGWSLPEYQHTRTLPAHQPTPLFMMYFTAWVDESGQLQFAEDIYRKNSERKNDEHFKGEHNKGVSLISGATIEREKPV
ncbi:murein L,D-transpeptidase [Oceanisphaera profunda]|uniref:Murein L,D-transpeptidase n=1 Tax=Oceanisphaera profunda TaxID=1416627 RepID=A0A1Y0D7W0_9GAMM|nr:L,D-transpeptidase family protein [Oceanisphaera profunda]ART83640.1 murein L,D-transpeptidase [Oceanisphaera profunda]